MTTAAPMFGTDEILWYDNGKWGAAGYAVANPSGKTWTNNSVIFAFHSLVGRNMFELLHRSDVRFYTAPHKQFWFELHQLIVTARKRLADRQRLPNDSNGLVVQHATPTPQTFLAWPIPFFGERIRQPDIREYAQLAMLECDRPIWAVAVPITIRYEGDTRPGASVAGHEFPLAPDVNDATSAADPGLSGGGASLAEPQTAPPALEPSPVAGDQLQGFGQSPQRSR